MRYCRELGIGNWELGIGHWAYLTFLRKAIMTRIPHYKLVWFLVTNASPLPRRLSIDYHHKNREPDRFLVIIKSLVARKNP